MICFFNSFIALRLEKCQKKRFIYFTRWHKYISLKPHIIYDINIKDKNELSYEERDMTQEND